MREKPKGALDRRNFLSAAGGIPVAAVAAASPIAASEAQAYDPGREETKARYPLREARVEVKEIPGKPGSYNAVAYMRPWLQMEELTTSMRMVARIPQKA